MNKSLIVSALAVQANIIRLSLAQLYDECEDENRYELDSVAAGAAVLCEDLESLASAMNKIERM